MKYTWRYVEKNALTWLTKKKEKHLYITKLNTSQITKIFDYSYSNQHQNTKNLSQLNACFGACFFQFLVIFAISGTVPGVRYAKYRTLTPKIFFQVFLFYILGQNKHFWKIFKKNFFESVICNLSHSLHCANFAISLSQLLKCVIKLSSITSSLIHRCGPDMGRSQGVQKPKLKPKLFG